MLSATGACCDYVPVMTLRLSRTNSESLISQCDNWRPK